MAQNCFLCYMEIKNTSLIFKKSDLTTNDLSVPPKMTEEGILCVNCFDRMLKSPKTNIGKARIDKLVNILEKEMEKNEVNVDSVLDRLDAEMNGWGLSEPVKTACLSQVMDILEVAIQDDSERFSSINQIRNILSLNFDASQIGIKD